MNRKKGLRLFITSCIPGCGQMYQGYMKRGTSLMLGCCLLFTLSVMLRLDALVIFFIPAWLYAFFDSYNLRSFQDQGSPVPDEWLFDLSVLDRQKVAALCRGRHSIVGWGLVILGCYSLFETVLGPLLSTFCHQTELWWLYDLVMNFLPRLVMTIGIMALGVWFIRGPKAQKSEDIPLFIPPAPAENDEQEDGHGEN